MVKELNHVEPIPPSSGGVCSYKILSVQGKEGKSSLYSGMPICFPVEIVYVFSPVMQGLAGLDME
jgi:hypothetical protein